MATLGCVQRRQDPMRRLRERFWVHSCFLPRLPLGLLLGLFSRHLPLGFVELLLEKIVLLTLLKPDDLFLQVHFCIDARLVPGTCMFRVRDLEIAEFGAVLACFNFTHLFNPFLFAHNYTVGSGIKDFLSFVVQDLQVNLLIVFLQGVNLRRVVALRILDLPFHLILHQSFFDLQRRPIIILTSYFVKVYKQLFTLRILILVKVGFVLSF
jgi:hypothetical protein